MRRLLSVLCLMLIIAATGSAASYQIVVQCTYGTDINKVAAAYGGTVLDYIPNSSTWLLQVPSLPAGYAPSGVVYAEANLNVAASVGTGRIVSTKSAADWYRLQPAMKLIRADAVRSMSTGRGIVIADINSLVDYGHPSLAGHLTGGYDFVLGRASTVTLNQSSTSFLDQSAATFLDQSSTSFLDQSSATFLDQSSATFLDNSSPAHGHGTLVAGIIAAIAPQAMIMPIRAFDDQGGADIFTISKSIYWAVQHGARVINMSFGALEYSKTLQNAIKYADDADVVLVASAGNNNTSMAQYPAAFNHVLAVAATNLSDQKASFSNYGKHIFVDAPGVNIISSYPGGYYALVSGTSFSAPIVAAEAALMLSLKQSFSESDMEDGTVDIRALNPKYADGLGRGRVDLLEALRKTAN